MNQISLLFRVISLIMLCVILPTGYAASLDTLPQQCHFSSQFKQTKKLSSLPVPLISSGKMYFSCQAGLIWETQEPIQESLILTRSDYHFKQLINSNNQSETEMEVLDSIEIRYLSRLLIGLMSSDKEYINRTFQVNNINTLTVELTPKGNFLSKAIKTVRIEKPKKDDLLNINIDQKDGTLINIQTHSLIALDDSKSNIAYCLQSKHKKTHCQALFEPLKTASELIDDQQQ